MTHTRSKKELLTAVNIDLHYTKTNIFASQNWILINLKQMFPLYSKQSINLKENDDSDWFLYDGNIST